MVLMYKYIITKTTKSVIEVNPNDVDPETIDFIEECMKKNSEIGFLDEEEVTGDDWMNEELDENSDLDFKFKKVKL